jgi:hypothetical protein
VIGRRARVVNPPGAPEFLVQDPRDLRLLGSCAEKDRVEMDKKPSQTTRLAYREAYSARASRIISLDVQRSSETRIKLREALIDRGLQCGGLRHG